MNGADLFAQALRARGVEWISTLCGHGLNEVYAACERAGIRLIDTRNEQTAAYMAECWGRLSGQVGVCAVSSGVAHANAMTGVVNAHFDGAPMLLLTGAGAWRTAGTGHFQDLDQVALAAPVCKYARVMDVPARIPEFVHEAFAAALGGRPGPVHLTFPMDVQDARVEGEPLAPAAGSAEPSGATDTAGASAAPQPGAGLAVPLDRPSREVSGTSAGAAPPGAGATTAAPLVGGARAAAGRVAALLERAERPLLVAGSGAFYAGAAPALAEFAAAYAVPVVVPIWDRGTVPVAVPEYMGVIGAASGDPALLGDADLVLAFGVAADYRVGHLRPPALAASARVVRVDVDPTRLAANAPADLAILADPAAVVEELLEICIERQARGFEEWLDEARRRTDAFQAEVMDAAQGGEGLHALDIIQALEETLSPDAVLIVDGGNIGQWFHQTLGRRQYPARYLTCGASGVVGFGLPAAMAARVGFPRRPVVLLSGDGSATFTIADLECAARQGLPFVMIVADDRAWGIAASGHLAQYGKTMSSTLGPVDFAAVARGLGALGVQVSDRAELVQAVRRGLADSVPVLVHVPIDGGMPGAS